MVLKRFHRFRNSAKTAKSKFGKTLVSWRAPEYVHHEKSLLWFIFAALVVVLLVWYGLATDGWTFSVAVLVFAGTYYLMYRGKPRIVEVAVSNMGIKIGGHVFHFGNLKNFWIVYDPPFVNKLYLRSKSKLKPDIFVSLENAPVAEIKSVLSKHLAEMGDKQEPFSDTLIRIFKL